MANAAWADCPGCGVRLPLVETAINERLNASAACRQCYDDLSSYTLTRADRGFIHQLAVDAYAAQHAGDLVRPITVAFALVGLYFAIERGYTGQQVQHMHALLAQRSRTWPCFAPPPHWGAITAPDVLLAAPGLERDALLRLWAGAIWAAWASEHERVAALVARVMAE